MNLFINYFKTQTRRSFVNLFIARSLLVIYTIWKLLSIPWERLQLYYQYNAPLATESYVPMVGYFIPYLQLQVALVIILLLLLFIGYKIKLVAFFSAILLTLIGTQLHQVNPLARSTTLGPLIIFLVIYAIHAKDDKVSVDAYQRYKRRDIDKLNGLIGSDGLERFDYSILKWWLLVFGIIYFSTGFGKTQNPAGILEWISPDNMSMMIHHYALSQHIYLSPIRWEITQFIFQNHIISFLSGLITVLIELGLIFIIVSGLGITIPILLTYGMHSIITISMGPLFVDFMVLPLLFLSWDDLLKNRPHRDLCIIYNKEMYLHVCGLIILENLSYDDSINYIPKCKYEMNLDTELDDENGICVGISGNTRRGYDAFVTILHHTKIFFPIAMLIDNSLSEFVLKHLYSYINK